MLSYKARVSAKVTEKDKELLKKSGYNPRHAIEYFVKEVTSKQDMIKVEKYFLEKEINDLKMDIIVREMRLEQINDELDLVNVDGVDYDNETVNSFEKTKNLYLNNFSTHCSLEDFLKLDKYEINLFFDAQSKMTHMSVDEYKNSFKEFMSI